MTKENLVTAPEGTDLKKAEKILQRYKIEKLPVVNKQGKLIGLITFRDILQLKIFQMLVKILLDDCWWVQHWALQKICWTGLQHYNM